MSERFRQGVSGPGPVRDGSSESGQTRHDSSGPGGFGEDRSSEPGLFACLYQPPLPRALAGSAVMDTSQGATNPARSSVMLADQGQPSASACASGPDVGPARSVSAGTWPPVQIAESTSMVSTERPMSPLIAIAAEFSPRYEQHRVDLVSMDLRGLSRLFGSPRAIGAELRREAASRGVRVHVATAPTRTAALVLALMRPGLTVVPAGGVARALAAVPIAVLEQVCDDPHPSVGNVAQAQQRRADATRALTVLRSWGLRTLGELAALPATDLSARLGRSGRVWQAIARGEDTRPLVPMQADERFEGTLELEWPIEGQEPLSFVLTRLLEPLSTRLERRDRGVAVLHTALHLVTREVHTCRLELPSPLRDVRALRTLVLLDVETHPPAAAIDAVTITIEPTPGRILQHTLFARPHPTPEQLSTLLARLGALMGQDRVGAPALLDSHRPGAFALTPFAIEHRTVPPESSAGSAASSEPWPAPQPGSSDGRVVSRDFRPPVSALRRCRQPIPARVATGEHQRPLRVFTDRRGFAGGAVVSCAGPWRTSGAWWEDEDHDQRRLGQGSGVLSVAGAGPSSHVSRGARPREGRLRDRGSGADARTSTLPQTKESRSRGPWSRDEWDVALADGAVYRIFRDRTTDGWFIDGVVD